MIQLKLKLTITLTYNGKSILASKKSYSFRFYMKSVKQFSLLQENLLSLWDTSDSWR